MQWALLANSILTNFFGKRTKENKENYNIKNKMQMSFAVRSALLCGLFCPSDVFMQIPERSWNFRISAELADFRESPWCSIRFCTEEDRNRVALGSPAHPSWSPSIGPACMYIANTGGVTRLSNCVSGKQKECGLSSPVCTVSIWIFSIALLRWLTLPCYTFN